MKPCLRCGEEDIKDDENLCRFCKSELLEMRLKDLKRVSGFRKVDE